MAISIDSKVKEILACPEAVAVLEELAPGSTKKMRIVSSLPLRTVLKFPEANCDAKGAKVVEQRLKDLSL